MPSKRTYGKNSRFSYSVYGRHTQLSGPYRSIELFESTQDSEVLCDLRGSVPSTEQALSTVLQRPHTSSPIHSITTLVCERGRDNCCITPLVVLLGKFRL